MYQIRNSVTGAVYVGGTKRDFTWRHRHNRAKLNGGHHHNLRLQADWTALGSGAFCFEILEVVEDASQVHRREQYWLDQAKQRLGADLVYNMLPAEALYEGFVDPIGEEHRSITNLKAFCRNHGLDFSTMLLVDRGVEPQHKGWTRIGAPRDPRIGKGKTYRGLIAPDGTVYEEIWNLRRFCREHGLRDSSMLQVLKGERPSHRGWTAIGGRPRVKRVLTEQEKDALRQRVMKPYPALVAPDGTEHPGGQNLRAFCLQHGLDNSSMAKLIKRLMPHYKGWTVLGTFPQRQPRPPIKTWPGLVAPDGTVHESVTNLSAFCREHGLSDAKLILVMQGKRNRHRGWRRIQPERVRPG